MATRNGQDTGAATQIKVLSTLMLESPSQVSKKAAEFIQLFDESNWDEVKTPLSHTEDRLKFTAQVDEATVSWSVKSEITGRGDVSIPRHGRLLVEGQIDDEQVFVETGENEVPCPDKDTLFQVESEANSR